MLEGTPVNTLRLTQPTLQETTAITPTLYTSLTLTITRGYNASGIIDDISIFWGKESVQFGGNHQQSVLTAHLSLYRLGHWSWGMLIFKLPLLNIIIISFECK